MRPDEHEQTAAAARFMELARLHREAVNPAQADHVAALHDAWPNLGPVAIPLGIAYTKPDSPLAERASRERFKQTVAPRGPNQRNFGPVQQGSVIPAGVLSVLKPVVKYGSAGLAFPVELSVAAARGTAYDAGLIEGTHHSSFTDLLKQTTIGAGVAEAHDQGRLGEAVKDVFTPGTSDEEIGGDGWFIGHGTATAKRQAHEAITAGMVDGHAATVGRMTASAVGLDPGSTAYNAVSGVIDTGVQIWGDPSARMLGAIGHANLARGGGRSGRVLGTPSVVGAGPAREVQFPTRDVMENGLLVNGTRPMTLPERFLDLINSKAGDEIATTYAGLGPGDYNTLNRMTNGKLPLALRVALLDEKDPVRVKGLLADAVASGAVREAPGVRVRKPPPRLLANMPHRSLRISEPEDAVENLDRVQRTVAHLMGEDLISKNNEALARALISDNPAKVYDVIDTTMKITSDVLQAHGLSKKHADQVTRLWGEESKTLHSYGVDDIGRALDFPGVTRDANGVPVPTPHLLVEALDDVVPLPNVRDLKIAARRYKILRQLEDNDVVDAVKGGFDFITQDVFKTLALATRPAWPVRVLGEELLFRMTGVGLASPISSPMSYWSILAGMRPDSRLSKALKLVPGVHDQQGVSFLGKALWDDTIDQHYATNMGRALNKGTGGWGRDDYGRSLSDRWLPAQRGTPDHPVAVVHELVKMGKDPLSRWMAEGAPLSNAQKAFWDGKMSRFRERMVAAGNQELTSRAGADEFMRTVQERLLKAHGGDPELAQAIVTNRLRGQILTDGAVIKPGAYKAMRELLDEKPTAGPDIVSGPVGVSPAKGDYKGVFREKARAANDAAWNLLGTLPSNRFTRSVTWTQYYYNRGEEMLPLMTVRARKQFLHNAEKNAHLPRKRLDRMREAVKDAPPGTVTLKDADAVAGAYALRETKNLLYDLHEKGQWADVLRNLVPFGEAFREVLIRWAQINARNPKVPYRIAQTIQGAQDDGSGVIYDVTGTPHPDEPGNRGFFYTDNWGEERFSYPGSQLLTTALGDPSGYSTPVQGLNMFGSVTPGFGPAVSLAAGKVTWRRDDWEWLRQNVISPYGDPDTGGGVFESFFPSYMQKIKTALDIAPSPKQQRALANYTGDVAAYLLSTGDYDVSTPEGKDHLIADARKRARMLYLVRGIAQSTLPSAPSPTSMALDKHGKLTFTYLMAKDMQKFMADDYKTATAKFIDKWGADSLLAVQSSTFSVGASPVSEKAYRLRLAHPEVARRYPLTFGLFAGPDPDNYSTEESLAQIEQHTRVELTPEEMLSRVNDKAARVIRAQVRAKMPDHLNPDQSQTLRDLDAALAEEYPGYSPEWKGSTTGDLIRDLVAAASDPVLAKTDAGAGLSDYLRVRSVVEQKARQLRLGDWRTGVRSQYLRDALRDTADIVMSEHPDFKDMWERVLSRELTSKDT